MARILLVDDDEDLIEMNRTVMTQRGHEVTVAYSAAEAWKAAQASAPDAAVLDIMLEDKDAGFELARRLHGLYPALRIIVLSGIRTEMKLARRFEPDEKLLPVSRCFEKPMNPRILADELDKLLASRG
jgi:CheY-like chemotaxis protein